MAKGKAKAKAKGGSGEGGARVKKSPREALKSIFKRFGGGSIKKVQNIVSKVTKR